MGDETVLIRSQEKMSRAAAAAFLRELADKLHAGRVLLKLGTEEVVLEIPERVELKIKAEEGDRSAKRKLEAEVEWVLGGDGDPESLTLG